MYVTNACMGVNAHYNIDDNPVWICIARLYTGLVPESRPINNAWANEVLTVKIFIGNGRTKAKVFSYWPLWFRKYQPKIWNFLSIQKLENRKSLHVSIYKRFYFFFVPSRACDKKSMVGSRLHTLQHNLKFILAPLSGTEQIGIDGGWHRGVVTVRKKEGKISD